MTAVKPGLAKLNIKPQANSLNTMKSSFASATRAQGVSYGIMAQRSIFSTGVLRNPKLAYSGTIASTRAMLNANRPMLFANVMPHQCNHNSGDDTMNKFMMGMMAMNMVAEMTAGITKGIKDIKAARADRSEKKANTETPKQKEVKENKEKKGTDKTNSQNEVTVSSNVKASIDGMKNAKDSATLTTYIESAQTNYNNISGELTALESELSSLKGQTSGLETAKESTAKALSEHNTKVGNLENNTVPALRTDYDAKELAYMNAQKDYDNCSDPKQKAILSQMLDTAKQAWETARNKLEKAENDLNELKSKTPDLKAKADKAEQDLKDNNDAIKTKEKNMKQLKKDQEQLTKTIQEEGKRLKELKEKEQKDNKSTAQA